MMEKNWIMTFQIQKYSQIFQKKISAERKHSVSSWIDISSNMMQYRFITLKKSFFLQKSPLTNLFPKLILKLLT